MRQFVFAMIIIIVCSFPIAAHAEEDIWKQLNQTSDRILQLVKSEGYVEAKQLLDYFATIFFELDFQKEKLSMNDLRVITTSFERAKEAVTAYDMPKDERIYRVTSFRLAVDALSSEFHPLWLQSEERMMNSFDRLEEALKNRDMRAFQSRLNDFLTYFEVIRPALLISLNNEQFYRIQSQIKFLENKRNQVDFDVTLSHLQLMKEEWTNLYNKMKEDTTDPSLWWVIFAIGSMITLSLSYVGWKKYKGEKQKVRVKE